MVVKYSQQLAHTNRHISHAKFAALSVCPPVISTVQSTACINFHNPTTRTVLAAMMWTAGDWLPLLQVHCLSAVSSIEKVRLAEWRWGDGGWRRLRKNHIQRIAALLSVCLTACGIRWNLPRYTSHEIFQSALDKARLLSQSYQASCQARQA